MYVRFPALSEQAIANLLTLRQQVPFKKAVSHRRRMGANGINALSIYSYSRWFDWSAAQRKAFKQQLPADQIAASLIGWYLDLDKEVGFLDRMTTWVDKVQAGTILSYALGGDQVILLNDEEVVVPKGTGIGFSLRVVHEIKPSPEGQLWACNMLLGDPARFVPVTE